PIPNLFILFPPVSVQRIFFLRPKGRKSKKTFSSPTSSLRYRKLKTQNYTTFSSSGLLGCALIHGCRGLVKHFKHFKHEFERTLPLVGM
ncbi:MAG: hypothetical protein SWE60_23410, partial [Thermodesulfobacteriota bacterium]|nr:hypothetical protein [Thermodesulfobacteriota bacterium]